MARRIELLSARKVGTIRKPGLVADGGGLYLQVSPSGAKSWIFRFMLNGRARHMGLGGLRTVSLKDAREAALDCRKLVRDGIDPIDERRRHRGEKLAASVKAMTFEQCAEAFIKSNEVGWKSSKHVSQWRNTLRDYAYPKIGKLPVDVIDTGNVLAVLEPIWNTKTETAGRVRGRIERVLDWATVRDLRIGENPARWRGHLEQTLPKRSKVQRPIHHAALPYSEIGEFMAELRGREEVSALALEFLILTAARTGEIINATWDEFDLDAGVWTVPAERMKAGVEHRVPLSETAKAVLLSLPRLEGNEHVFPGLRSGRPLSNMAMLQLLSRMGRHKITVHGFRSSFRDWAAEHTAYPRELAERALAHVVGNKAEAAYQRGDMFEKRRQMMNAWEMHCAIRSSHSGNITPIRRKLD